MKRRWMVLGPVILLGTMLLCVCVGSASIAPGDALGVLARFPEDRFGLIFLDPPYEAGLIAGALERIMRRRLLREGGLIVCETLREEPMPPMEEGFRILREYLYGKSKITLIVRESGAD